MSVELTEGLLSQAAGWEVMKRAKAYVEQGQVLSSYWAPPLLRGVVQAGEVSFRASMVVKSHVDVENLCTCRDAREWGKICENGVAVGLHWLKGQKVQEGEQTSNIKHQTSKNYQDLRSGERGASERGRGVQRDENGEE